jgi:hypothetical protein
LKAALAHLLPAVLFCAYPIAIVAGANVQSLPLDGYVLTRAVVAAVMGAAIGIWLLKWIQPDLPARAAWVSWILLLSILYESFVRLGEMLGMAHDTRAPAVALSYLAVTLAIATMAARPWKVRPRDPRPLAFFAAALLVITLYPVLVWGVTRSSRDWQPAAEALVESALAPETPTRTATARDIYYIVLDGFGRADVLERIYGVAMTPFVSSLASKGFYVAERAHSNYGQTYLSLASTLNMSYLDSIAALKNSTDRRPLDYLIRTNALMQAARRAGYKVVGMSSDYMATEQWSGVDECVCRRFGLDEFDQSALEKTPFAGLPLDRWAAEAHRQKVRGAFAALEATASDNVPTFVFAHIVAPHPPFVFQADGSARQVSPQWRFSFGDGDHFMGSRLDYLEGYRDQTVFVTRRLASLVDVLLNRPGPEPVIVIHGDHGPGSLLLWEDPGRSNLQERMAIFAAYLLPEAGAALYPTISPVNGARLVANRYLGIRLPLLPDRAFFSTWEKPYDLIPIKAGDLE